MHPRIKKSQVQPLWEKKLDSSFIESVKKSTLGAPYSFTKPIKKMN